MIALINCGGSGSRLWPLSTPEYPKHLLKVSNNPDDGTLLQETYKRVKGFVDDAYFITEAGHASEVKKQLGDVDDDHIIIEPARRGTASCLLIALDHIRQRHDDGLPLIFMHADHVIHDTQGFRETIQHAAEASLTHNTITLLGLEPTYPSTGFGYIEQGSRKSAPGEREVYEVAMFKEKPDRATAEAYVRQGRFLWNMGYFAAPLRVFVDAMKKDSPQMYEQYQSLVEAEDKTAAYLNFTDIAIDYALMEPASMLHVVPGSFDWIDVGNFQDLHSISPQDEEGNALSGEHVAIEDVTNSFVRNDTMTKLAVVGLDNVAVVVTDNGILVANRNYAHKVGDVAKRLNAAPNQEEK
jgi:mannose-1-phosphate guanylyltransferase/mannose-6-phosphate isomerase